MDRNIDPIKLYPRRPTPVIGITLLVVACAVALLAPITLSTAFWLNRYDLLGLPFFVSGLVALLYGPTHRMKDGICYIGVIKDHVNLGFIRGSELADPQRILEGTGKQMRHIKIRNMSDLFRPAIRAYLQEACERAGYEVATEKEKTVTTVVKRKSLPKRTVGTTRV